MFRGPILSALCVVVTALAAIPMGGQAEAQSTWTRIRHEKGIEVFRKEIKGQEMPMFRGRAVVAADLYTVLAVLSDFDRHTEWMHGCYDAKLLKEFDDFNRLSYNRADAPWPVADRDVVLRSKVVVDRDKKRITIHFKGVKSPLMPEVEDVVRMKRLKGYYQLTALGPNRTRVQYQVNSDPGGSLPTWLAAKASEEIPLNTLHGLRKRLKAVVGGSQYDAFIRRWNPAFNPDSPGPKLE
ncbi:MAG: START domain-containing protein [Myxococcota bacterium]